jgi:hypothetical protein
MTGRRVIVVKIALTAATVAVASSVVQVGGAVAQGHRHPNRGHHAGCTHEQLLVGPALSHCR